MKLRKFIKLTKVHINLIEPTFDSDLLKYYIILTELLINLN